MGFQATIDGKKKKKKIRLNYFSQVMKILSKPIPIPSKNQGDEQA
jgi:hypothetical protein